MRARSSVLCNSPLREEVLAVGNVAAVRQRNGLEACFGDW